MKDILLFEKVPSLENNFTVKFMQCLNVKSLIPHWHEHLELIYIRSGRCTFTVNGNSFSAEKNDLIIVNSTEIHSFVAKEYIDYFCMLIYPDFFSDVEFYNILLKTVLRVDISEHYSEKITTAQLAAMCYLSESHFCRFFKGNVGKSAIEYINEYRIEKAAVMLKNTDESITEIASLVGFDDVNYFSRTFRKIKKMTPKEYKSTLP